MKFWNAIKEFFTKFKKSKPVEQSALLPPSFMVTKKDMESNITLKHIHDLTKVMVKTKTLSKKVTLSFEDGSFCDVTVYCPYRLELNQSHSQYQLVRSRIGFNS